MTNHQTSLSTPHTNITDDQLLELIRSEKDREKGYRLLLKQYQRPLYMQIRRLVLDHHDADDVLQNCLLKAFRNLHTFEGKSKLYTWLCRIAINEAITFLKNKKRHANRIHNEKELHQLTETLKTDPFFDGDELQIRLLKAIGQLPEKQRMVFQLRYFDEMPYNEIAALLGTSEGGLKASFHHAVRKIEDFLTRNNP